VKAGVIYHTKCPSMRRINICDVKIRTKARNMNCHL